MVHTPGYCCINITLKKQGVFYSRDMRKATFDERGIAYASELALKNATDFVRVLQWNVDNKITVFRMGSNIFPWANKYILSDLPDYDAIVAQFKRAASIIKTSKQRVTAHPDHFVKLASDTPHVRDNAIADLELHSTIFDLLELPRSPYAAINIHVGQNFSTDVVQRWLASYDRLSDGCKSRLVVENDDKANAFSVQQLYDNIHKPLDIPITFDYFHHGFHPDGLSEEDAFHLAASTWSTTPLFHFSDSRVLHESATGNARAHSDYVYTPINDYNTPVDIDLEVKAKELALFKYLDMVRDNEH